MLNLKLHIKAHHIEGIQAIPNKLHQALEEALGPIHEEGAANTRIMEADTQLQTDSIMRMLRMMSKIGMNMMRKRRSRVTTMTIKAVLTRTTRGKSRPQTRQELEEMLTLRNLKEEVPDLITMRKMLLPLNIIKPHQLPNLKILAAIIRDLREDLITPMGILHEGRRVTPTQIKMAVEKSIMMAPPLFPTNNQDNRTKPGMATMNLVPQVAPAMQEEELKIIVPRNLPNRLRRIRVLLPNTIEIENIMITTNTTTNNTIMSSIMEKNRPKTMIRMTTMAPKRNKQIAKKLILIRVVSIDTKRNTYPIISITILSTTIRRTAI